MEKEPKGQRTAARGGPEPDFLLQWGNRKRPRCLKIRDDGGGSPSRSGGPKRTASSSVGRRVVRGGGGGEKDKDFQPSSPPFVAASVPNHRKSESAGCENRKSQSASSSPEKEDRFYPTRGSAAGCEEKENANGNGIGNGIGIGIGGEERGGVTVLPRLFVSLSNKEKEEDFMAMKGCKLPQRPKKRSKFLQKSLLLVSPGAWLTDLSLERYEVREKKSSRKRRSGLKAMSMESDSE